MKTQELTGYTLDWAVSLITNPEWGTEHRMYNVTMEDKNYDRIFNPSGSWLHGGPIIERESLCVGRKQQCDTAYCPVNDPTVDCWARTPSGGHLSYGPTPLIAAMRCYVRAKLGDEINIPEELL